MKIRLATEKDLPEIITIFENARAFMRENGNQEQWNGIYPGETDILADIKEGTSYVCDDNGEGIAQNAFLHGLFKLLYVKGVNNDDVRNANRFTKHGKVDGIGVLALQGLTRCGVLLMSRHTRGAVVKDHHSTRRLVVNHIDQRVDTRM